MQRLEELRERNQWTPEAALELIVGSAAISDAAFDAALRAVERHAAAPSTDGQVLVLIAEAAVAAFNAGELRRAARLFGVASAVGRREADEHEHEVIVVSSDRLDVRLFVECVNDPDRHADITPLLNFFPDLRVPALLDQLAKERRLARCEFVINMIAIHGATAVVPVLNMLDWKEVRRHDPHFLACLFAVVSRFRGLEHDERRRAANLAGRYVAHESTQVRSAALAALGRIGGCEALGPALKALTASTYQSSGLAPVELLPQLGVAMDLLAASGDEKAQMMVAEIAIGARGGEFKLGRRLESLAVASLEKHGLPLGPRAARVVARELSEIASNGLRLATGKLVHKLIRRSEAEHWLALLSLLVGSTDPHAIAVQAHEGLQTLAGELSDRSSSAEPSEQEGPGGARRRS
jgi:hypothetical protein